MSNTFVIPLGAAGKTGPKDKAVTTMEVPSRNAYVPGLVITAFVVFFESGDEPVISSDRWVLTHRQSGRTLGATVFPSIASARRGAKAVAELVDWKRPGEELIVVIDKPTSQRIGRALREVAV